MSTLTTFENESDIANLTKQAEQEHRVTGHDDRRQPDGAGELLPAVTTEARRAAGRYVSLASLGGRPGEHLQAFVTAAILWTLHAAVQDRNTMTTDPRALIADGRNLASETGSYPTLVSLEQVERAARGAQIFMQAMRARAIRIDQIRRMLATLDSRERIALLAEALGATEDEMFAVLEAGTAAMACNANGPRT